MALSPPALAAVDLYAWLGEPLLAGAWALQTALLGGRVLPLVGLDLTQLDTPDLRRQLEAQVLRTPRPLYLCRFTCAEALRTLRPPRVQ